MTNEDSATDLSRFLEWKHGFDARLEETKKPGFDKDKLKDGRSNENRSEIRSPAGSSTSKRSGSTGVFQQANSVPLTTSSETTSGLQGNSVNDGGGRERDKQVVTSEGPSVLTIQLVEPDPVSIFKAMRATYSSLIRNIFDKCFYLHFPKVEELVETLQQYQKQVKDTYEEKYGLQLVSETWEDFRYWIVVQENILLGQNIERQAKCMTIYHFLKKAVIDFGERLNAGNISEYGVTRDVLQELVSWNVIKNQITQLFGEEWIKLYNGRRLEICGSIQQCIRLVQQYQKKVESMFDANQLPAVALEELKMTAEEDLEVVEAALDKVLGAGMFVYCFENLANEIYRSFKSKAERENRNWDQAVQYATECYVDFMMEKVGDGQDIPENAVMKQHEEVRAKVTWAFDHVSGFLYSKIWTMDDVSDDSLICQFKKVQEERAADKRAHQQESRGNIPESTIANEPSTSTADLDETALVIDEDQKNDDDDEEARSLVEMWNQLAEEVDSKPKFQKPILADSAAPVEEVELIEEPMDDHAESSESSDSEGIDAADVLSNIEYESCESDTDSNSAPAPESEGTQKDLTIAATQVKSLETISSQEDLGANLNSIDLEIEEGEIMSPIRGPSSERDRQSPVLQTVTLLNKPQVKHRAETTSHERNKPESSRRKRAFSPIRPPSPGPVASPIQSVSSIAETEELEITDTSEIAISMIITSCGVHVACCRDGEKHERISTQRFVYIAKSDDGLPILSEEASLAAELLNVYELLMNRDKIRLFSTQYWIDGQGHYLYAEEALALYFMSIKSQINDLYNLQFQREWIAITVPVTMPPAGRTRLKTALELAGMPNTVIVQTTTALVLNEPAVYPGSLSLAVVVMEDLIEVAVIQKVGESFVTRAVKVSLGPTNAESLDKAPLVQRIYANMIQACEVVDMSVDCVKKCFIYVDNRRPHGSLSQIWKWLRSTVPKVPIKVVPTLGYGLRRLSKWKMNPTEDQEFLYQEVSPWTIEIDFGPGVTNCKLIEANSSAELRSRPVILNRLRHGSKLKIIRSMFCSSVSSFCMAKRSDQELEFDVGTWKSRYPNALINVAVDSQGLISLELDCPQVKAEDVVLEFNYMPLDKKTVRDAARRLQMMVSSAEQRPTTLRPIVQTVKRIKLRLQEDERIVVMDD